jgi:hypothetical protein
MAAGPAKEDAMCRHFPIPRALVAILLLGLAGQAGAAEFRGWVYDGLTGWSRAENSGFGDSALASNPSLGYRWGTLGVELGHAWFGKYEDSQDIGATTFDVQQRVKGWTAGLNFNHDLAPRWSMQARAGLFDWSAESRLEDGVSPALKSKDDGKDWYAGAAIKWQWHKYTDLGLGFTHYKAGDTGINVVGLATEHRFGGNDD